MMKNKKFVIMLAIFVLGAALLTGSAMGQEGEIGQADGATAGQEVEIGQAESITASGTLKAVDVNAGAVMIATVSGDELVLTLTEESQIQIGGALSDLTQLAAKIDSKVDVAYQVEAKTVTVISIAE